MLTVVFGGAFDPPHKIHTEMARAAVKELNADRLVILPTYSPPHKSNAYLSFDVRRELITTAFCGFAVPVIVDETEKNRGADNYAAFTLPVMKEKYGEIVYLIGGDSLEYFDSWYLPKAITDCCKIAVIEREGYCGAQDKISAIKNKIGGDFTLLAYKGKNISSSLIKACLLLGERPDGLDDAVYERIKSKNLFGEYSDTLEKLKRYESPPLYEHSKAVVKTAVEMNSVHNLKLDFISVFEAALLHDNAKERPTLDGLEVPEDSVGTSVLHQFLGAAKAERDFGVKNKEVLDAIRYHTTARPDMSLMEKLIYTADSVSYDREYPPIPKLRKIAFADFEEGFKAVLEYTCDKLRKAGKNIYPLTQEAEKYYIKRQNR